MTEEESTACGDADCGDADHYIVSAADADCADRVHRETVTNGIPDCWCLPILQSYKHGDLIVHKEKAT